MRMKRTPANGGFTLIEVALSILVVAIGVTASFSLFPEGLKLTRESVNATEVGLFADYVFQTLDVQCQIDAADEASWNRDRDVDKGLKNAQKMMKELAKAGYKGSSMFHKNAIEGTTDELGNKLSAQLEGKNGTTKDLKEFYWVPQHFAAPGSSTYDEDSFATYWTTAFTYALNYEALGNDGAGKGGPVLLTLNVWPGNNGTNAVHYVFAREILSIR
jgi:prepilin-type N-terminal cleavage/methylation domain-containing protein